MKAFLTMAPLLLLSTAGCGTDQPRPACTANSGRYAVRYQSISGQPAGEDCPTAELISVFKYSQPTSGKSTVFTQGYSEGQPPREDGPSLIGLRPETDEWVEPVKARLAVGALQSEVPEDSQCIAPSFDEIHVTGTDTETQESLDIRYKFSDVRFHVTAQVPGSLFTGTLQYEQVSPAACTETFTIAGVYPPQACITGEDKLDVSLCDQPGFGMLKDFPLQCDEGTGYCVLGKSPEGSGSLLCPNGRIDDCASVDRAGECAAPGVCTLASGAQCLKGGVGVLEWPCK